MASSLSAPDFLRRVALGESDFQAVNLSGASLKSAKLRGLNLRGANLRGASLLGADLSEARLMRADLSMADLGMTDFSGADLNSADFRAANLKGANFSHAALTGAIFRGADLHGAALRGAKLVRADLSRADLGEADIGKADLRGTDLRGATLQAANFSGASLQNATLQGADLRRADFTDALLLGANLTEARLEATFFKNIAVGATVFGDLDLRQALGLETASHASPSTLGIDTLRRSMGQIPEGFLRGCGLSPWEIEAARIYDPSLTTAETSEVRRQSHELRHRFRLQRRRVFILYSEADTAFVEGLRRLLLARGIASWVAVHERKGALRERQSKLSLQHDLALVLVLSENSVHSDWVEHEIRLARRLESSLGESVLSLVSLDGSWKTASWQVKAAEKIADESVLSFASWSDPASMEKGLGTLMDTMALFHPEG